MLNGRIAITLVLVFLAGVGTGMVGMRYGLHDQIHPDSVKAAANEDAVLETFRTELNLTNDQAARLAVILDDYRHYYQSLQDQIEELHLGDQIEDLRSTGKNRILEILNDDQRAKFEKMTGESDPSLAP